MPFWPKNGPKWSASRCHSVSRGRFTIWPRLEPFHVDLGWIWDIPSSPLLNSSVGGQLLTAFDANGDTRGRLSAAQLPLVLKKGVSRGEPLLFRPSVLNGGHEGLEG